MKSDLSFRVHPNALYLRAIVGSLSLCAGCAVAPLPGVPKLEIVRLSLTGRERRGTLGSIRPLTLRSCGEPI